MVKLKKLKKEAKKGLRRSFFFVTFSFLFAFAYAAVAISWPASTPVWETTWWAFMNYFNKILVDTWSTTDGTVQKANLSNWVVDNAITSIKIKDDTIEWLDIKDGTIELFDLSADISFWLTIDEIWASYKYWINRNCISSREWEFNPWTRKTCKAVIINENFTWTKLIINHPDSWMSWWDSSFQWPIFPQQSNAEFYCSKKWLAYVSWTQWTPVVSSSQSYTQNQTWWDNRWWCSTCINKVICSYNSYEWQ